MRGAWPDGEGERAFREGAVGQAWHTPGSREPERGHWANWGGGALEGSEGNFN